jgi:LacI family transcriptional regulator
MCAVERLLKLGRKVPDDVAVVGFDGFAAQIGFRPLLTSASFDRQEMARHAVSMLCRSLDKNPGALKPGVEKFPVQLLQGQTS